MADITYIRTRSGWLYLAEVLDLLARKVVCRALQLATVQRQPDAGLIVPRVANSDRGSQYASAAHQALLVRHGLVGSMSRKRNCWRAVVLAQ